MKPKEKTKPFPTFPVPAGAHQRTFKVHPDDEMGQVHNAAGTDPLTEKAASIVMPLLIAKKVTPKMISVMLEEVLKARKEVHSKSNRPNFIEYLRKIPKDGPKTCGELAVLLPTLAQVPAEESVRFGRDLKAAKKSLSRRKRVLLPEFEKSMAKKIVGSTQDDRDAVRGDR